MYKALKLAKKMTAKIPNRPLQRLMITIIMVIMISYLYRLNLFSKYCYQSRTCLNYTKLCTVYIAKRKSVFLKVPEAASVS